MEKRLAADGSTMLSKKSTRHERGRLWEMKRRDYLLDAAAERGAKVREEDGASFSCRKWIYTALQEYGVQRDGETV